MNIFTKILACFIALYGTYNFWAAIHYSMLYYWISGIVVVLASIGLFFKFSWSQYLVYLLSSITIVQLFYLFWKQIEAENCPYDKLFPSVISLIPGEFLILFCILINFFIFKYLKKHNLSLKMMGYRMVFLTF